ncbi:hypothetical protein ACVINW_003718 [Bradyrhizobium sp. USDA 4461]
MASDVVSRSGEIASGRERDLDVARQWMDAALEVKDAGSAKQGTRPCDSDLAIWQGADHAVCDPLRTILPEQHSRGGACHQSRVGIVHAQGGGRTMREIFEDAEQNYYAGSAHDFTPMIFFNPERFWEGDTEFDASGTLVRPGIKIDDFITRMFRYGRGDAAECLKKLCFTTGPGIIDQVLHAHAPVAQRNPAPSLVGDPLNIALGPSKREPTVV